MAGIGRAAGRRRAFVSGRGVGLRAGGSGIIDAKEAIVFEKTLICVLLLIVAAALLAAGCGKEGAGSGGDAAKTADGEDLDKGGEIRPEEGGEQIPTEESLMAPIYPGSEHLPLSGNPTEGEVEEGYLYQINAVFHTYDGVGEVVSWYTERVGESYYYDEDGALWEFYPEENTMVLIGVGPDWEGDWTNISIMRKTITEKQ